MEDGPVDSSDSQSTVLYARRQKSQKAFVDDVLLPVDPYLDFPAQVADIIRVAADERDRLGQV